jgi:hypothetical protein
MDGRVAAVRHVAAMAEDDPRIRSEPCTGHGYLYEFGAGGPGRQHLKHDLQEAMLSAALS